MKGRPGIENADNVTDRAGAGVTSRLLPRGVSDVWQTQDLERCVFGSVAMVGVTSEFSEVWQGKELEELKEMKGAERKGRRALELSGGRLWNC